MSACKKGRKILVAVDGSLNSKKAFNMYLQKIHRVGDEMTVLYVQEEAPVEPWPESSNYHKEWKGKMKSRKEQVENIKADYKAEWKAFGLDDKSIQTIVETGDPGHVICNVAEEEEVDLVIVGSRGQGAISRALLGSVSTYCVHHVRGPIVVVPTMDHPRKKDAE